MRPRFQADADFNHKIVVGLRRREPAFDTALDLYQHDSLSWWDSLIVSAAIQGGCEKLLSEDLQHGRKVRGVKIVNPFRTADSHSRKPG